MGKEQGYRPGQVVASEELLDKAKAGKIIVGPTFYDKTTGKIHGEVMERTQPADTLEKLGKVYNQPIERDVFGRRKPTAKEIEQQIGRK